MLPADWGGQLAQQLTAALYQGIYSQSEMYLRTVMKTEHGELPEAAAETRCRFGGF
jgi:DNA-binding transcriptional regulator PaaX